MTIPNVALSEAIRGLEFILAAIDANGFQVSDIEYTIHIDDKSEFKNKVLNLLNYYNRVKSTLDSFEVKDDLDIGKMTDDDWKNLNRLIMYSSDKSYNDNCLFEKSYGILQIANLNILIYIVKSADASNIRVYNPFNLQLSTQVLLTDNSICTGPFSIKLSNDVIRRCSNITKENVMRDINRWIGKPGVDDLVVMFLLNIIRLYDSVPNMQWVLELANSIVTALDNSPNPVDENTNLLNKLQITKRTRVLTDSEREQLIKLISRCGDESELSAGAYLLLDMPSVAENILCKLTDEQQANFRSYPIYYFANKKKQ